MKYGQSHRNRNADYSLPTKPCARCAKGDHRQCYGRGFCNCTPCVGDPSAPKEAQR